jgi:hypothetical protein
MRFSVVYVGEAKRWAVIDRLTSDDPIRYFSTEWAALDSARVDEKRWRTEQISCPRLN